MNSTKTSWMPKPSIICWSMTSVSYTHLDVYKRQANHIGVTIKADIVKQKLPSNNGGFKAIGFGKTNERMYSELTTDLSLIHI